MENCLKELRVETSRMLTSGGWLCKPLMTRARESFRDCMGAELERVENEQGIGTFRLEKKTVDTRIKKL